MKSNWRICFAAAPALLAAAIAAQGQEVRVWEIPKGADPDSRNAWREAAPDSRFENGAAMENGRIAVLIRTGSDCATISSLTATGAPAAKVGTMSRGIAGHVAALTLKKSEQAEAILHVVLDRGQIELRIGAGMPMVEIRPVKQADTAVVSAAMSYALIPDFFGYDTLYAPGRFKSRAVTVPAENFILGLLQGGNSMLMCVWEGRLASGKDREEKNEGADPKVELLFGAAADGARVAEAVTIELQGKPLHVALLGEERIWHEEDVRGWQAQKPTELAWKRPFGAKWRVNFMGKEGAWSRDLLARNHSHDALFRDSKAVWVGDIPIPTMSIQGLWPYFICPFWIVNDKAYVALYADMKERKQVEKLNESEKKNAADEKREPATHYPPNDYERLVIYPIERVNETPLAVWTLFDVLRNCLGKGPCEYIMDLEGIKPRPTGGSRDTLGPTCAIWNTHLKHFAAAVDGKDTTYRYKGKKLGPVKQGERLAPELEERLLQVMEDLVLFVTEVNKRVHEYKDFSDGIVALCEQESAKSPQVKEAASAILEKARLFQARCHDEKAQAMDRQRDEWDAEIAGIVKDVKAGKYDNVRRGGKIRDYAESQDIFIAQARLYVKALQEEVSAVESDDPEVARFAGKVRTLCHGVLRRKHTMEAW